MLAWCALGGAGGAQAQAAFSPGVYGRVQPEADAPPPPVLNARPVQVRSHGTHRPGPVLYLHVPAAEARHWAQHCARHQACSAQVFFVDGERWATLRRQARWVSTEGPLAPGAEAADPLAPSRTAPPGD
ncbi:hypothetical protein PSQ40_01880 [Curvibacter sp. HBC61]|uniref:Uncharacterized protein n=1 Tax=Curvibacter cyanobacteriorum TaxID=3026422 RepID=A0ABT5MV35_9BURK|nr:hypothetical protein [Curvibacter sp. HBC61]MDD0837311.1 hypothetical protein [Curvibacter sp. HBC61]